MKLALFFPGIGYHVDKPLLYYSRKIAAARGYEVVDVSYGGFKKGVKGSAKKMEAAFCSALEQTEKILKGVDFGKYEEILAVSKSVGTVVACAYAEKHGFVTRNIYYTPVEATFRFPVQPGIVFHGTKDGWVETEIIKVECEKRKLPLHIIKDANHSLETGDVEKDIKALAYVMDETRRYIG